MTSHLLTRARAGDGSAFRELTDPHRQELLAHCYRMLGSLQDAEDALQDTLLAAWRGLAGFEGRASVRTWLYRIATNRCLNALRSARRRPARAWENPDVEPPAPTRLGEAPWLEPYPDALLQRAEGPVGPEARYEQAEAISLAFVTALQVLPARQRAVLILREVLGYRAAEVAELLDSTVKSVNSALTRARAGLRRQLPAAGERWPAPGPGSAVERDLGARFGRAYDSGDVEALVALLTADVSLAMPPLALVYDGPAAVADFYTNVVMRHGRRWDVVPTRANGQLAYGVYLRLPAGGVRQGAGLDVLTIAGDRIRAITHFDKSVLASFGLPRSLPGPRRRGFV